MNSRKVSAKDEVVNASRQHSNYCCILYSHPSVSLHRFDPIGLRHVLNWGLMLEVD